MADTPVPHADLPRRRVEGQDRRALRPWELDPREIEALESAEIAPEASASDDEYRP